MFVPPSELGSSICVEPVSAFLLVEPPVDFELLPLLLEDLFELDDPPVDLLEEPLEDFGFPSVELLLEFPEFPLVLLFEFPEVVEPEDFPELLLVALSLLEELAEVSFELLATSWLACSAFASAPFLHLVLLEHHSLSLNQLLSLCLLFLALLCPQKLLLYCKYPT